MDFGGALIKSLPKEPKPEVVPLQRLAFCDQTNLLGGAICEKHFFLPDELKEMLGIHAREDRKKVIESAMDTLNRYVA